MLTFKQCVNLAIKCKNNLNPSLVIKDHTRSLKAGKCRSKAKSGPIHETVFLHDRESGRRHPSGDAAIHQRVLAGERRGAISPAPGRRSVAAVAAELAPRVNGAGVVFSRQPASAHAYQTGASRSIFSPHPFGRAEPRAVQRQHLQRQPLEQRAAYRATSPGATIDPLYLPQRVAYSGGQAPGTIVISTTDRFLYLVGSGGSAMRYGIGVGRAGFSWAGDAYVNSKQHWPKWHPPAEMIDRKPELEEYRNGGMDPGLTNPLGARALYLFQNGRDTLFRIHGTPEWWTIGTAASSGCIRMINQDVIDLYERVPLKAKVIVKQGNERLAQR